MSLATPAFLLALGLLLPVLVAFLVRRQRHVIRVPSTMVWRRGARSIVKNRRIRDVRRLLALLACLIGVAALVVAAARPTGTRSDTTVYVVDVSASMEGAPIAEARTWLSREVASRGPDARIAIILADSEARVALSPSPPGPLVDETIRGIKVGKEASSIDEAVALAEGLASSGARIIVLSDQSIDADVSRLLHKPEQRVFGRRGRDNLGITSLFTRSAPDARDDEREASIAIACSSTRARRARLIVTLGGRHVADRRLDVPARGELVERVLLRGAGRLVARVQPDDGATDALAIDDEASLAEVSRRPPRVALVHDGGEGSAHYFVAKALAAAGVTEVIDVAVGSPAPDNAEIAVVLTDGRGRPSDVPAFLIGVEPPSVGLTARSANRSESRLRSMATEDPILRGVALDDVTTLRAKVAVPPGGARTLVDLDAGPTLIAGGTGAHAWVWLGIDPEGSDLVLRVAFPVLVSNVLAHLGGASQVVFAKTTPRAEVMLDANESPVSLSNAPDPTWRVPVGPPLFIAMVGAFLLMLEGFLTFYKRSAALQGGRA